MTVTGRKNPDPLLRELGAPFRKVLYPLGKRLLVESNDARALECARTSFGHFPRVASPGRAIHLRLLRDPQATSRPPWPRAAFRSWGDLLAISCDHDNFAVADLKRKYAVGFFSAAMLADAEFFGRSFVEALTYVILAHHDFAPVHAAGVVRGGRGICLAGPAGAGKTSLAYYCARHGYALLADDSVHLTRGPGSPGLRGNPSRLYFTPQARQLFPELVQYAVSLRPDGQELLAVSPQSLGIPTVLGECKARAVVFLDRGRKKGLRTVPAREAVGLLYRELPVFDPGTMKAHRRAVERLARCGAYRMGYGTLEEAWELLERIPQ